MEMPQYGCVHLSQDSVAKIQSTRQSHAEELEQALAIYFCTQCPISGNILSMDRHISKTKHEFATNYKSVYCGQCKDLVYEPKLLPANTKKRKLSEATEEDESLLA